MYSEGRVTRSKARTLAVEGHATPLFQVPDGKTPRTRARTARKGAEVPTPRAVLLDLTNAAEEMQIVPAPELPPLDETKAVEFEQDLPQPAEKICSILEIPEAPLVMEGEVAEKPAMEGIVSPEMAPVMADAMQEGLMQEDSVDCAASVVADEPPTTPPPASAAPPAYDAGAPTPTGLGLSSLLPMSPMGLAIVLPVNTPAVTPLHGVPADAKVYETLNAAVQAFAQQEQPMTGFGSPVKIDSPIMSISIGGRIPGLDLEKGERDDLEVCAGTPAGAGTGMPSPALADKPNGAAAQSPVELPASPATIAMQEVEDVPSDCSGRSAEAPVQAVPKATLRSQVVVPSPYDPRSLRQLKKEIQQKMAEKESASAANSEDEQQADKEEEEHGEEYYEQEGDELLKAMGALELNSPELNPYILYGMPKPKGQHIRFDDDGEQSVSPGLKTLLRGMPTPHGKHVYFDESENDE